MENTAQHIVKPTLYMSTSRFVAQLVALAIFFLCVRFLSVEEFGVYALASAVSALFGQLAWVGFHEYALKEKLAPKSIGPVLGLALAVGAALTVLLLVLAHPFSLLWGDGRIGEIVIWWAVIPIPTAVAASLSAIMYNEGRYATASMIGVCCELFGLAFVTVGLMAGLGLQTLIYHRLLLSFLPPAVVLLVRRPEMVPVIDFGVWKKIAHFVRSLSASHIIGFASTYGADLVLGVVAGPAASGVYRFGARIVLVFDALMTAPLSTLAWTQFARVKNDSVRLAGQVNQFSSGMIFISMAIFLGLAAIAEPLIQEFAAPEWAEAAIVVQILAITAAIRVPLYIVLSPALGTVGQEKWLPVVRLSVAAASVAAVLLLSRYGVAAAAFSQMCALFVSVPFALWLMHAHTSFRIGNWLRMMATASVMGIVMWWSVTLISGLAQVLISPLNLLVLVVTGVIVYCGLAALLVPELARRLYTELSALLPGQKIGSS